MAVKILITVEGSEQVKSAVDDVKKHFEGLASSLNSIGDDAKGKSAFQDIALQVQNMKPHVEEAVNTTEKFRESIHLLHPILRAAGLEVGAFGGFARAASVGVIGLGAAIAGSLAISLARLEDDAKKTRGELEDLFQSGQTGKTAFNALTEDAKRFGTTVSDLAPGFEALTTAWQRFVETTRTFRFTSPLGSDLPSGAVGSIKNLTTAYDTFIKLLRAGRLDQENASKSAAAFFKSLQEGGQVTADILKALPVGTVQQLAEALGRGGISAEQFINQVRIAPIPLDKLLEALGRFGPEAQKAFDSKAIITYKDVLGEILTSVQDGFKQISGFSFSDAAVGSLNRIRDAAKQIAEQVEPAARALRELRELLPARDERLFNVPLPTPRPETAPKFPISFKFVPPDESQIGEVIDKIDQEVEPKAQDLGKTLQEAIFGKELAEQGGKDWGNAFSESLSSAIQNSSGDITRNFESITNNVLNLFQQLYNDVVAMWSNPINIAWQTNPFLSGQPTNLATGGLVRGPGTTTSDSILARLSDKEFVLRANATQFYGVDFLNALNSLRIPRMPGFSMGGLVDAMARSMPRFADGGMVTSQQTPITLVIDQQRFNMTATGDTVKALSRFAVARQVTSTGRKPSWIR